MSFFKKIHAVGILIMGLFSFGASMAHADLSLYVANVAFDKEANLEDSPGIGVRWGKSSRIIGGETSLLIARPERNLGPGAAANATALFYEGRLLVNIPLGQIKPFIGVGFGAVTITSTDVPTDAIEAFTAVSDLQNNSALSYGGGVSYAISDNLYLRLDWRQYVVFSVKGIALDQARQQVEEETGVEIPASVTGDNTVQYNELSLGVSFKF